MSPFVSDFNTKNPKINIVYVQKDTATFDQTLVESIAGGTPPDLVLLPNNLIWRFGNKLTHIPFTSLPAQTMQTTFIDAANTFVVKDGTLAIPWAADPLVMYYNRDLLQNEGIAQPPKNWTTFAETATRMTKKTSDLTITQSGAALGTYKNILHPKDILALLFMESGSSFITTNNGALVVDFGPVSVGNKNAAAVLATDFFMSFSNPVKSVYSWNAGLPTDRDLFIQSKLAYYFGTASELPIIRAQNPNLNFSIALPPQSSNGNTLTTGSIYGFAIPKTAPNQLLSYTATTLLSGQIAQTSLTSLLQEGAALTPVRRDVLAIKPTSDPYLGFLYDATLVQKVWTDPNPIASNTIFSNLISNINSSAYSTDQALARAAAELAGLGGN
jgi:ABC-type glycerol-3-phosphate transport system substrate-binding protein